MGTRNNKYQFGLAQIPIILGLLLMAVTIPAVTKLSQQNQDTRNKAASKVCTTGNLGTLCINDKGIYCQEYRLADCSKLCNQNCGKFSPVPTEKPAPTEVPTQNTNKTCTEGNLGILCINEKNIYCQEFRKADCSKVCNQNCGNFGPVPTGLLPTSTPTLLPTPTVIKASQTITPTRGALPTATATISQPTPTKVVVDQAALKIKSLANGDKKCGNSNPGEVSIGAGDVIYGCNGLTGLWENLSKYGIGPEAVTNKPVWLTPESKTWQGATNNAVVVPTQAAINSNSGTQVEVGCDGGFGVGTVAIGPGSGTDLYECKNGGRWEKCTTCILGVVPEYVKQDKALYEQLVEAPTRKKDAATKASSGDLTGLRDECKRQGVPSKECDEMGIVDLGNLVLVGYDLTAIKKDYDVVIEKQKAEKLASEAQKKVLDILLTGDRKSLENFCVSKGRSMYECGGRTIESLAAEFLPEYDPKKVTELYGQAIATNAELKKQNEVIMNYLSKTDEQLKNEACNGKSETAYESCVRNFSASSILSTLGLSAEEKKKFELQKKAAEVINEYQYGLLPSNVGVVEKCRELGGNDCSTNEKALATVVKMVNNPDLTVQAIEQNKTKIVAENKAYEEVAGTLSNLGQLEKMQSEVASGNKTWTQVASNLEEVKKDPLMNIVVSWNDFTGGRFKRGNDVLMEGQQKGDLAQIVRGALIQGGDAAAVTSLAVGGGILAGGAALGVGAGAILTGGGASALVAALTYGGVTTSVFAANQITGQAADTCQMYYSGVPGVTQGKCLEQTALAATSIVSIGTGALSQVKNIATGVKVAENVVTAVNVPVFTSMAMETCSVTGVASLDCVSSGLMAAASTGKLIGSASGLAQNAGLSKQAIKTAEEGIKLIEKASINTFAISACAGMVNGEVAMSDRLGMCALGLSGALSSRGSEVLAKSQSSTLVEAERMAVVEEMKKVNNAEAVAKTIEKYQARINELMAIEAKYANDPSKTPPEILIEKQSATQILSDLKALPAPVVAEKPVETAQTKTETKMNQTTAERVKELLKLKVEEINSATTRAKEKIADEASATTYEKKAELIVEEKGYLSSAQAELAKIEASSPLYSEKQAEITKIQERIATLENLQKPSNYDEVVAARKPTRDGKTIEQLRVEEKAASEALAKVKREPNLLDRLRGFDKAKAEANYLKQENQVLKLQKRIVQEEAMANIAKEMNATTDPISKSRMEAELQRLSSLSEPIVSTGNERLDIFYENVIRNHEMRMTRDGMAGKNNVFSVDASQIRAYLDAVSSPNVLLEFALAGGKTTVIGPLVMKTGELLYGRTGQLIAKENAAAAVFKEVAKSLTSQGDIPVERITDVVLFDKIGDNVLTLRDRIMGAKHVITEVSAIEFLKTMVYNGKGSPAELTAAREILVKLEKKVSVFTDEAHLNFDPNKTFVQSAENARPVETWVKETGSLLGETLKNLGVIEKGKGVNLAAVDGSGNRLVEVNSRNETQLSKAGREALATEVANKLNLPKEKVLEIFENGEAVASGARKIEGLTTEQVNNVLNHVEVAAEFGKRLGMKQGSDFDARSNTEGGKKTNSQLVKDGVGQPDQQLSGQVAGVVFEIVSSEVLGMTPNLEAVTTSGRSAKAAFADHIAAVRGSDSSLAAGTGTIGRNRGTLETAYKLATRTTDVILEKFLGTRGDQGLIKEQNIFGIGVNDGTPASRQKIIDQSIAEVTAIKENSVALGNKNNAEVVLGGKEVAPEVWIREAAKDTKYRGGQEHEFVYLNSNGEWMSVKVTADGTVAKAVGVVDSYAKNVLDNPNTKNTTVVIGEGGATGTNVLAQSSVPGIDVIDVKTGRDQLDQSAARINRKKGGTQETFMLVIGKDGPVSKTELRSIANEVQRLQNQENTYQAVSAAIDVSGSRLLKEIIINGKEGSPLVKLAREALLDLQNPAESRNFSFESKQQSPLEALKAQSERVNKIYSEIREGGKYEQLYREMKSNSASLLAEVAANAKPVDFKFAAENEVTLVSDGVLGSKNLAQVGEIFGKTITSDLLPERVGGGSSSKTETVADSNNGGGGSVSDGGFQTELGQPAPVKTPFEVAVETARVSNRVVNIPARYNTPAGVSYWVNLVEAARIRAIDAGVEREVATNSDDIDALNALIASAKTTARQEVNASKAPAKSSAARKVNESEARKLGLSEFDGTTITEWNDFVAAISAARVNLISENKQLDNAYDATNKSTDELLADNQVLKKAGEPIVKTPTQIAKEEAASEFGNNFNTNGNEAQIRSRIALAREVRSKYGNDFDVSGTNAEIRARASEEEARIAKELADKAEIERLLTEQQQKESLEQARIARAAEAKRLAEEKRLSELQRLQKEQETKKALTDRTRLLGTVRKSGETDEQLITRLNNIEIEYAGEFKRSGNESYSTYVARKNKAIVDAEKERQRLAAEQEAARVAEEKRLATEEAAKLRDLRARAIGLGVRPIDLIQMNAAEIEEVIVQRMSQNEIDRLNGQTALQKSVRDYEARKIAEEKAKLDKQIAAEIKRINQEKQLTSEEKKLLTEATTLERVKEIELQVEERIVRDRQLAEEEAKRLAEAQKMAEAAKKAEVTAKKSNMVGFIGRVASDKSQDKLNLAGTIIRIMGFANVSKWDAVYQAMSEIESETELRGVEYGKLVETLRSFIRGQLLAKDLSLSEKQLSDLVEVMYSRMFDGVQKTLEKKLDQLAVDLKLKKMAGVGESLWYLQLYEVSKWENFESLGLGKEERLINDVLASELRKGVMAEINLRKNNELERSAVERSRNLELKNLIPNGWPIWKLSDVSFLESLYGEKVGIGTFGITFVNKKTNIITKVFLFPDSFTDEQKYLFAGENQQQYDFYFANNRKHEFITFVDSVYGGFSQVYFREMVGLKSFISNGGVITTEMVNDFVDELFTIQYITGMAHGDLFFNKPGTSTSTFDLHPNNIQVQKTAGNSYRLVAIDFAGFSGNEPGGDLASDQFKEQELTKVRESLNQMVELSKNASDYLEWASKWGIVYQPGMLNKWEILQDIERSRKQVEEWKANGFERQNNESYTNLMFRVSAYERLEKAGIMGLNKNSSLETLRALEKTAGRGEVVVIDVSGGGKQEKTVSPAEKEAIAFLAEWKYELKAGEDLQGIAERIKSEVKNWAREGITRIGNESYDEFAQRVRNIIKIKRQYGVVLGSSQNIGLQKSIDLLSRIEKIIADDVYEEVNIKGMSIEDLVLVSRSELEEQLPVEVKDLKQIAQKLGIEFTDIEETRKRIEDLRSYYLKKARELKVRILGRDVLEIKNEVDLRLVALEQVWGISEEIARQSDYRGLAEILNQKILERVLAQKIKGYEPNVLGRGVLNELKRYEEAVALRLEEMKPDKNVPSVVDDWPVNDGDRVLTNLVGDQINLDGVIPMSLVDGDGYSRQVLTWENLPLSSVDEGPRVLRRVPLNRIVSLNTVRGVVGNNGDPGFRDWEITGKIGVDKIAVLMEQGQFDFRIGDEEWTGRELPGGYVIVDAGRHRTTAAFLTGVEEIQIYVKKTSTTKFNVSPKYINQIKALVKSGKIRGRIEESTAYGSTSYTLITEVPISSPTQLFVDVPRELLEVMAQTVGQEAGNVGLGLALDNVDDLKIQVEKLQAERLQLENSIKLESRLDDLYQTIMARTGSIKMAQTLAVKISLWIYNLENKMPLFRFSELNSDSENLADELRVMSRSLSEGNDNAEIMEKIAELIKKVDNRSAEVSSSVRKMSNSAIEHLSSISYEVDNIQEIFHWDEGSWAQIKLKASELKSAIENGELLNMEEIGNLRNLYETEYSLLEGLRGRSVSYNSFEAAKRIGEQLEAIYSEYNNQTEAAVLELGLMRQELNDFVSDESNNYLPAEQKKISESLENNKKRLRMVVQLEEEIRMEIERLENVPTEDELVVERYQAMAIAGDEKAQWILENMAETTDISKYDQMYQILSDLENLSEINGLDLRNLERSLTNWVDKEVWRLTNERRLDLDVSLYKSLNNFVRRLVLPVAKKMEVKEAEARQFQLDRARKIGFDLDSHIVVDRANSWQIMHEIDNYQIWLKSKARENGVPEEQLVNDVSYDQVNKLIEDTKQAKLAKIRPLLMSLTEEETDQLKKTAIDQKQPELTRSLLNERDENGNLVFFPIGSVMVDGQKMFFISGVFKDAEIYGQKNDRNHSVAFVMGEDGILRPRLFYHSNSDGVWRMTPYIFMGKYYKGSNYTQSTKIHQDLANVLNAFEEEGLVRQSKAKVSIMELFDLVTWKRPDNANKRNYLIDTYTDGEASEVEIVTDELTKYGPGELSTMLPGEQTYSEVFRKLGYPDGFVPDFSRGPVKSWKDKHSQLGEVIKEEYRAVFNGEEIRWIMVHDNDGRVWCDSIQFVKTKVTSYGTFDRIIDSGPLTNKPLEYKKQSRELQGVDGEVLEKMPWTHPDYNDITYLLDNLTPFVAYRKARNIVRNPKFIYSEMSTYRMYAEGEEIGFAPMFGQGDFRINGSKSVNYVTKNGNQYVRLEVGDVVDFFVRANVKKFLVVVDTKEGKRLVDKELFDNNAVKIDVFGRKVSGKMTMEKVVVDKAFFDNKGCTDGFANCDIRFKALENMLNKASEMAVSGDVAGAITEINQARNYVNSHLYTEPLAQFEQNATVEYLEAEIKKTSAEKDDALRAIAMALEKIELLEKRNDLTEEQRTGLEAVKQDLETKKEKLNNLEVTQSNIVEVVNVKAIEVQTELRKSGVGADEGKRQEEDKKVEEEMKIENQPLLLVSENRTIEIDGSFIKRGAKNYIFSGFDVQNNRRVAVRVPIDENIESLEEVKLLEKVDDNSVPKVFSIENMKMNIPSGFNFELANISEGIAKQLSSNSRNMVVMEFINGASLNDLLLEMEDEKLFANVNKIVENLGKAVDSLAKKGIYHRDISAGNVMLTDDGEVKLIDFELANKIYKKTASDGLGLAQYSPPEAESHWDEMGLSSEVFNLAVLAYNLLSGGSNPYGNVELQTNEGRYYYASTPARWRDYGLTETPYESLSEKPFATEHLSADQIRKLDGVFKKALAIDPKSRYQSAVEFSNEVLGIINVEKPTSIVPVPLNSIEYDRGLAEKWIADESDPAIKLIKRKVIDNLNHVTFAEFMKSLDNSVSRFNKLVAGSNYSVFFDYKPHASKRWVYELAKPMIDKKPTNQQYIGSIAEVNKEILGEAVNAGVDTFVVFDDGIYSGEQVINRFLKPVYEYFDKNHPEIVPKFIIVSPYATQVFVDKIAGYKSKGLNVEFVYEAIMPRLAEILSREELDYLIQNRNGSLDVNSDDAISSETLTYFDHRVADNFSFSLTVAKALKLSVEKPYAVEGTEYYMNEEKDFEQYQKMINRIMLGEY